MEVHGHEQRVVVEHLLEVRDQPVVVDRSSGGSRRRQRRTCPPQPSRRASAPTISSSPRRRRSSSTECGGNFGARPNPPDPASKTARRPRTASPSSDSVSGSLDGRRRDDSLDRRDQLSCGARDVAAALGVRRRDGFQHLAEARQPVARLGREVRAAVERPPFGREEDGHRPAAVPGQRDDGVHVDRVEVRPLLAVDLDVDEALVHQRRGLARPRTTRAPSRGTSGTPRSRSRAGSAGPRRARGRAPPRPTGTSRPGSRRAGGDTGSSTQPADSRFALLRRCNQRTSSTPAATEKAIAIATIKPFQGASSKDFPPMYPRSAA